MTDHKKLREICEQQLKFPVSDVLYDHLRAEDVIALLDERDELDEECRLCADIAAEYGCLPADAPHDAVRTLGNRVEDLQGEVLKLRQATSRTGAEYLVDAAVSVQRERDELKQQLSAMTSEHDALKDKLRQRNESIAKLNAHIGWNATNACSGEDGCWCDAHARKVGANG